MALSVYAIGEIYVNGLQLFQEASMTVSRKTNSQIVATVMNGYSGESPGAPMSEISVTNAVPSAGYEFDPGKYMGNTGGGPQNSLQPVTFVCRTAGKNLTFNGFIIEDDFGHAVNSEAKLSFKARGEFNVWT